MPFSFVHPSDAALDDFADGGPASGRGHRIAAHLENCQRCRNRVAFHRDLRVAASSLSRPAASDELLKRILRDRAAGERVILPTGDRTTSKSRLWLRAAAILLPLIGLGYVVLNAGDTLVPSIAHSARTASVVEDDSLSGIHDLLSATVFFPGVASASESNTPHVLLKPVGPQIDGRRIRIREAAYQQRKIDGAGTRTIAGEGTTTVRPVTVAGSPAWRIERTWIDYPTSTAKQSREIDSMLLDARDLHFIERHIDAVPYGKYSRITVTQKFNGDSIYGHMASEGADSRGVGRDFLRRLPRTLLPYTTDALAPLFFTAINVTPGWRGRVSVLGWAVRDNDVFYPVELREVGRERVTVPAGSFECWHFVVTYGTHEHDFWARTSDGLVVRVLSQQQKPTPSTSETVLLRATP